MIIWKAALLALKAGNTIFFRNGLHYLIYPIGHEVRNLWMKKWPST